MREGTRDVYIDILGFFFKRKNWNHSSSGQRGKEKEFLPILWFDEGDSPFIEKVGWRWVGVSRIKKTDWNIMHSEKASSKSIPRKKEG